ncbi:MAG: copper chaperone [Bacteroidia bacterium]|nr:copper chaperone [Bacteroidia bacterium]
MKKLIKLTIAIICLLSFSNSKAQDTEIATYTVYGNCGMCKKTIEKAANKSKDAKGSWNRETKVLTLTYNTKKTTSNEVLKRIADVGYDNEKYVASQASYDNLHECCKYERKKTNK